jgi:hypothetical protein
MLRIRQVFGDGYLTLPVRSAGNLIVFAFRDGLPREPAMDFASAALDLKRALGLDFPRYVRRIAAEQIRRRVPYGLAWGGAAG